MKFWRDNGLTLTLLAVTAICLLGMVWSGLSVTNQQLQQHGKPAIDVAAYVLSGSFISALFENWESEFLQMAAYVMLTATLFQRGSAESRDPDQPERDGDELPERWHGRSRALQWIYAHSLGLALTAVFLLSFVLHWLGSWAAANEEAVLHGRAVESAWAHLASAQFWFESFQNWQSEFMATAALVVLSIFLRFRNSPESKPVSAADSDTGA